MTDTMISESEIDQLVRAQYAARKAWREELGETEHPEFDELPKNVTEIYYRDVRAILAAQRLMGYILTKRIPHDGRINEGEQPR